MKFKNLLKFIFASFFTIAILVVLSSSKEEVTQKAKADEETQGENNKCFDCHGKEKIHIKVDGKDQTFEMKKKHIISNIFYDSNHGSFKCVDCHSADYDTFPHPKELVEEPLPMCMDCHSDDKQHAEFKFESVNSEFEKSVHFTKMKDAFTCWKCHDPHTYKIFARKSENINETVTYGNNICLKCHTAENSQASPKHQPYLPKHDWLPNQKLHFTRVRCIDCHTSQSDSTMVSHLLEPKQKAVHNCVECHTKDSRLMNTLYKFQTKENRKKNGFFNAIILNNSYVIGANRNQFLNNFSIAIFILTIVGIISHALLRYFASKKKKI